jgi:hypothetical protein
MACLDRNPAKRPQTKEELEYELRKSLRGRASAVAHILGMSEALQRFQPGLDRRADSGPSPALPVSGASAPAQTVPNPSPATTPAGTRLGISDSGLPASGAGAGGRAAPRREDPLPANLLDVPARRPVASPSPAPLATGGSRPGQTEVDEDARTDLYIATAADLAPPPPDPAVTRRVRIMAGALAAEVVGFVAALLLLWPKPADPGPVQPRPPASASAPVPGAGDAGPAVAPVSPSGRRLNVDAGVLTPEVLVRRRTETIDRWVQHGWRAARDRRILRPVDDSLRHALARLAALDPAHPELTKLRAFAEQRLLGDARADRRARRWEPAEATLRGLLELSPDLAAAKEELATVLVGRGRAALKAAPSRPDEADKLAQEALGLNPGTVDASLLRAEVLVAAGKLEEALAAYEAIQAANRREVESRRAIRALKKQLRKR